MHQTPKPSATSSVNRRMAAFGTMHSLDSSSKRARTRKRTGVAHEHTIAQWHCKACRFLACSWAHLVLTHLLPAA